MNQYVAIVEDLFGVRPVRVEGGDAQAVRSRLEGRGFHVWQIQHWLEGWPDNVQEVA